MHLFFSLGTTLRALVLFIAFVMDVFWVEGFGIEFVGLGISFVRFGVWDPGLTCLVRLLFLRVGFCCFGL